VRSQARRARRTGRRGELGVDANKGIKARARCRVDVDPIAPKNLPGYMTVNGKVRCNHRLLAGEG
jgi:hypothetical protein